MNSKIVNNPNFVPLEIKYVSFSTKASSTLNAGKAKTIKLSELTDDGLFPKGWYPIGIIQFSAGFAASVISAVQVFQDGRYITADSETLQNVLSSYNSNTSDAGTVSVSMEYACIPVQYVATHLCEYKLWKTESEEE